MNQSIVDKLQQLGLSGNEAKVYTLLLQSGQTSAGTIIKGTQLHRSVVYETFDKLIHKKLVFKIEKKNIAYFQATDPQRLLQNIKKQEDIALGLIPTLRKHIDKKLPEITIYEGIESYKQFWLDSVKRLPVGSTDYISGSTGGKWVEYMGRDYNLYQKIRLERKIKWKMIVFDKEFKELELLEKYPTLNEFRSINKKWSKDGNFNVFADESVVLHSATEPMIIEIKNQTLVKVFKHNFDLLWELGSVIKRKK